MEKEILYKLRDKETGKYLSRPGSFLAEMWNDTGHTYKTMQALINSIKSRGDPWVFDGREIEIVSFELTEVYSEDIEV